MVNTKNGTQPPYRLMRDREVAATLNISVRQVWKLSEDGVLPSPVRLGRTTRWRAVDIDRLVESAAGSGRAQPATNGDVGPVERRTGTTSLGGEEVTHVG